MISPTGPDVNRTSSTVAASFNLLRDGTGSSIANGANGNLVGTTASPLEVRLGALRTNGGPTLTLLPLGGSPAVDAGDPLFNGYGLTDQRGYARVANGRVDIGAVESSLRTFYTFDSFGVVDVSGNSAPVYAGDGGQWWNSDHRGQGVSAIALNDLVGGTPYGTNNYYRLTTPGDPTNSNRGLGLKGNFTVSVWVWPRVLGGWIEVGRHGDGVNPGPRDLEQEQIVALQRDGNRLGLHGVLPPGSSGWVFEGGTGG